MISSAVLGAAEGHGLGAKLLGQAHVAHEVLAGGFGHAPRRRVCSTKTAIQSACIAAAMRRAARMTRADVGLGPTQTSSLSLGGQGRVPAVARRGGLHLGVDAVGGAAEGQFAQGDQVRLLEEVLHGPLGLVGHVDLALGEPLQQLVGRQVDELDLVGPVEDGVGHGLADHDAGDLGDDVVEALEVLDVEGGVDVDAGGQQLLDVLPALGVAEPGALVWASSSTRIRAGLRARAASRSNSLERDAAVLDVRGGRISRPSRRASVSGRPWGST